MSDKPRLTDLDRDAWRRFATEQGHKPYRGDQVWEWIFGKGILDPDEMSSLPKDLKAAMRAELDCVPPAFDWKTDLGSTTDKLYMPLGDDDGVEAVLIMEGRRSTACVSSQLGCPVGCRFCASGLEGLQRNLTRGEILLQFLEVRRRAAELGRRLSNVVMMGMGEPLLNYRAVLSALDTMNDARGGGIGARHLTVSTVGLPHGIDKLKAEGRQYTLAFSLHAPNDELRRELVPFTGAMSIDEMIATARSYLEDTGREVTFEYVLLDGVNAEPEHAKTLVRRLSGVRGTVNLIPYNENPGLPFRRPADAKVDTFARILRAGGQKVSVRKRKGHKILAACGQLRLREKGNGPKAVEV